MRRGEALVVLAVAALLVMTGFTWLYGPWALVITGIAFMGIVLFTNLKE